MRGDSCSGRGTTHRKVWCLAFLAIGCTIGCRDRAAAHAPPAPTASAPAPAARAPAPPAGAPTPPTGAPALPTGAPVKPGTSALLDIFDAGAKEAKVVAVIDGSGWQSPGLEQPRLLKRLVKGKPTYQVCPSPRQETTVSVSGRLSGRLRSECGDYYAALARPSAAGGFAIVSSAGTVGVAPPAPMQSVDVKPAYVAAVAGLIARATKLKVSPTIERAYSVDLDGNGKPEIVLQATHPDLQGAPPEYKPEYYSLIVVLPDAAGAEPVFAGYLQSVKDWDFFEVLEVDSVADVDGDGKPELLVRARFEEGWQTQVFRFDGKLKELFREVAGEGQCPGSN